MKKCADCLTTEHEGGCNWLDWMVTDDKCPHCSGPVTEISTVTALGRYMDNLKEDGNGS